MRVFRLGDKLAVAAYKLKRTRISDLPEILTRTLPSHGEEDYFIEIQNLSITKIIRDPYIEFEAVDHRGNLWYGLTAERRDKYLNIKDLTMAMPAENYNPKSSEIKKNAYFDITEVLHNLRENIKNEKAPVKARDSLALYKKIQQAFAYL